MAEQPQRKAVGTVRRRGRPAVLPEADRRDRLLEAAEAIFLDRGYAAATMDDVAQEAGMSKKTLYLLFDSKAELFRAVLRNQTGRDVSVLPDAADRGQMRDILVKELTAIVQMLVSPRQVLLMRLIVSEAHRVPELAEAFRREAFEASPELLVQWLARMSEKGFVSLDDPDETAEMLVGAAIGASVMKAMTSADIAEDAEAEKAATVRRIHRAVTALLPDAG